MKTPDAATNTFIRQVYKFRCFDFHAIRGFPLFYNKNGGYDFYACFYFSKRQIIKRGYFKPNEEFNLGWFLKDFIDVEFDK